METTPPKLAILGLGYVGLPLAAAFAKRYAVVGYDLKISRIADLRAGQDTTQCLEPDILSRILQPSMAALDSVGVGFYPTAEPVDLASCQVYIVTVPTPIDRHHQPDFSNLLQATARISQVLKKGDIVIYESTVYPGATEEKMVPLLEKGSGLVWNRDFFGGYSPERINPGDPYNSLEQVVKVTSGSTPAIADYIDRLYQSIIPAGTYQAPSIQVAEAAKVIENTQRDINIAFVNELAKIFHRLNLDTQAVLKAAQTKWNFMPFQPGLVGGHCIGVDPYYLAQKAIEVGYVPEMILAGRRINDSMGTYVATEVVKFMLKKGTTLVGSRVLILGLTFKEDFPDVRNTRVMDMYHELRAFQLEVDVYDPIASPHDVAQTYGVSLLPNDPLPTFSAYAAVILAVAHSCFRTLRWPSVPGQVIYDVKSLWPVDQVDGRL
ncbi:MAG: nucleotide sugar dehydrogenase [Spirosomataceae bacterium]